MFSNFYPKVVPFMKYVNVESCGGVRRAANNIAVWRVALRAE